MCAIKNKVRRSLWKTFTLSFSQLYYSELVELADWRGWKLYFYVDYWVGEIHRGLGMGVDADIVYIKEYIKEYF